MAAVQATFNNTLVNVTSPDGDAIVHVSAGMLGFKNSRRGTQFAAQQAGVAAAQKARAKGITTVRILVNGFGQGRNSAIKGIQAGGLVVHSITDVTPVPHNGCRPKKARRL